MKISLFGVVVVFARTSGAFLLGGRAQAAFSRTRLMMQVQDGGEVEDMRFKLEGMFEVSDDVNLDSAMPIKKPSSTRRKRESIEKNLISQIGGANTEDVIARLWKHWYSERGPKAHKEILDTSLYLAENFDNPRQLDVAVEKLDAIIAEYSDWAEPINQRATILYLQGKYEESIASCEKVLKLKPWHFGACSGIIMCYTQLQDEQQVTFWRKQVLPPEGKFLTDKGKIREPRKLWVDRMIREFELQERWRLS
uniref:ER membrane protein complex subunit 2 n=1 Tax=Octactis speculum TaxID=3111310 RepID=A0A7S2H0R7_9STRA|mmetsp:Transcript_59996/g.82133  ORF Transcript_59996/g.82133 Transcript_59996/m.82133 type:complete len:252 (+) Transcript_59996:2-757(+)